MVGAGCANMRPQLASPIDRKIDIAGLYRLLAGEPRGVGILEQYQVHIPERTQVLDTPTGRFRPRGEPVLPELHRAIAAVNRESAGPRQLLHGGTGSIALGFRRRFEGKWKRPAVELVNQQVRVQETRNG